MPPKYVETEKQGIETLRALVRAFSHCNETFLQRFTASQLCLLFDAYALCDRDTLPDAWDERQIQDVIQNEIVPQWVGETPVYFDNITTITKCVVCGETFAAEDAILTCSESCSFRYIWGLTDAPK